MPELLSGARHEVQRGGTGGHGRRVVLLLEDDNHLDVNEGHRLNESDVDDSM